jgi:hypothetical protein
LNAIVLFGKNQNATPWQPELQLKLIEHWEGGLSAALIAERLNAEFGTSLTRNSIIGRVNRQRTVGVTFGNRKPVTIKPPRERVYRAAKPPKLKSTPPVRDLEIPVEQRKTFMELGDNDCRFAAGHCVRAYDLNYKRRTASAKLHRDWLPSVMR